MRPGRWRDEIVYFAFTDRFHDGCPTNNQGVDKADVRAFHGGDLQGIIDKLDYLRDLGITTLWISPPMRQQARFVDSEGYHGYWPVDFRDVDPHQGDLTTFRRLVSEAHRRGLKLLLDLPLNHTAWEHPWRSDPSKASWYHHNGDIKDWDDPTQLETFDVMGLPDLDQSHPAVYAELLAVARFWIEQGGIDGFRLDAVKHVGHAFWRRFCNDVRAQAGPGFVLLGEDLHGDPAHLAPYQAEGMTALLDYPLYYSILDSIGHGGSMRHIAARLADEDRRYPSSHAMAVFVDNHDVSRFITEAGAHGLSKLRLALALCFTLHRVPCLYQGTELGMAGTDEGKSPDHLPHNREDMRFGSNPALTAYVRRLATLRRSSPALRVGSYRTLIADDTLLAYMRTTPRDAAIVALNSSPAPQHRTLELPASTPWPAAGTACDALSGRTWIVRARRLTLDLPPYASMVLLPVAPAR